MSDSTPYQQEEAAANKTVNAKVSATDTVTGEIVDLTEVKDLTAGSVAYYDEAGAVYVLGVNQELGKKSIATGAGEIKDVTTTVTTFAIALVTVPAFTTFARGHIEGGAVIYTIDGTDPDITASDEVGTRVSNGGYIELHGADSIANFKVLSYDGATSIDIDWEFKNIEK